MMILHKKQKCFFSSEHLFSRILQPLRIGAQGSLNFLSQPSLATIKVWPKGKMVITWIFSKDPTRTKFVVLPNDWTEPEPPRLISCPQ